MVGDAADEVAHARWVGALALAWVVAAAAQAYVVAAQAYVVAARVCVVAAQGVSQPAVRRDVLASAGERDARRALVGALCQGWARQ